MAITLRAVRVLFLVAMIAMMTVSQCNASTSTVVSFDSHASGCLAWMSDGSVWTWGSGNPVPQQTDAIPGVKTAFQWGSAAVALRDDGTVWVMTANSAVPMQLPLLDNVQQISGHSVLKGDGTVWVWSKGSNVNTVPVQVPGLTGIVSISDCAGLKSDGTVWEWGIVRSPPDYGYSFDNLTPVRVPISDVKVLYDSATFGVALKTDGSVWSWGHNTAGQLGDGSTCEFTRNPVKVSGLTDVVGISQGNEHVLALKSDGTLWGWGSDQYGQLGASPTPAICTPVKINVDGVDKFAALGDSSIISKTDGSVWSWGRNDEGQLGGGTTSDAGQSTPLRVLINVQATPTPTATPTATAIPTATPTSSPVPGKVTSTPQPVPTSSDQPLGDTGGQPWIAPTDQPQANGPAVVPTPTPKPAGLLPFTVGFNFGTLGLVGCVLVVVGVLSVLVRRIGK